jgi:hypothetical protein
MFTNQNLFYFATIRKITAAFGDIFTNVYIQRFTGNGGTGDVTQTILVPLQNAATQKWLNVNEELVQPAPAYEVNANKKNQVRKTLPRMSFEMMDLQPDRGRKLPTMNSVSRANSDVSKVLNQLVPVPFDFAYNLYIETKDLDDSFQIIEQILPNFTPDFNVTLRDIPEMNIERDMPVIFTGINKEDNHNGQVDDDRTVKWTLTFVAKGHLYPVIKNSSIIKKVFTNIYTDPSMDSQYKAAENVTKVEPQSAGLNDTFTVDSTTYERDSGDPNELDSNGEPVTDSNG